MVQGDRKALWAYLLIGVGSLMLLSKLGGFAPVTGWLWALLFLAAGGAFLYVYRENRHHWWALIPGFALVALGLAALSGDAAGGVFLSFCGVGFAAVYAADRARWWALIPAGVLFTLALIAWLEGAFGVAEAGWLFFVGLAATFAALYLLPGQRQRWAVYPALGALVLALLTLVSSPVAGVLVPLLLVLSGVYLVWRRGKPETGPPPVAEKGSSRGGA